MDDEQLIQLVQIHPELYDYSDGKYMNSCHKESVWTLIGDKLNQPSSQCKTRWCNIRDNYRKSEYRNKKKYKYGELLHFLRPHLEGYKHKERHSGFKESSIKKIHKKKNIKKVPDEKKQASISHSIPIKRIEIERSRIHSNPEVVDTFLASIASVLKQLSPYHLNLAKSKIFAIVQELELQMLLEQSGQCTASSISSTFSPESEYSQNSNNSFLSSIIPETVIKSSPNHDTRFYEDS